MGVFSSKQTYEEFFIGFDFSLEMGEETIESATVTATDSIGADVLSTITDPEQQSTDGVIVYLWVKGGVSGEIYHLACQVVGSNGGKFELDGYLKVQDF